MGIQHLEAVIEDSFTNIDPVIETGIVSYGSTRSQTAHVCHLCSAAAPPQQGSGKQERLTRCRGATFLTKYLIEGFILDDLGEEQPADSLIDGQQREPIATCDVVKGERSFHQSCAGRQQDGSQFDQNFLSYCCKKRCYARRNICHLLCVVCLALVKEELGDTHEVQPKLQSATGELAVATCDRKMQRCGPLTLATSDGCCRDHARSCLNEGR